MRCIIVGEASQICSWSADDNHDREGLTGVFSCETGAVKPIVARITRWWFIDEGLESSPHDVCSP